MPINSHSYKTYT